MARNFYMSPFYFFGWSEIARDMEAQNFFLADTKDTSAANAIKVYPSAEAKTDIEMKYRDAQPEGLGMKTMQTGFLSSI